MAEESIRRGGERVGRGFKMAGEAVLFNQWYAYHHQWYLRCCPVVHSVPKGHLLPGSEIVTNTINSSRRLSFVSRPPVCSFAHLKKPTCLH